MENLLKPDIGLMFWTVVTFLVMVLVLKKLAWEPLLKALDEREEKIKKDIESAQKNREEMEQLKAEYARQLSEIESCALALLSEAEKKGTQTRESILKEAQSEALKLAEKTRQQLQAEKEKILKEMQGEVAGLSILMAEKLLEKSIDKQVQDKFIQDFLKSLDVPPGKMN